MSDTADAIAEFIVARLEEDETEECGHAETLRQLGMFAHVMTVFGEDLRATDAMTGSMVAGLGEQILRVMAAAYAAHPDYRREWGPLVDEALAAQTVQRLG